MINIQHIIQEIEEKLNQPYESVSTYLEALIALANEKMKSESVSDDEKNRLHTLIAKYQEKKAASQKLGFLGGSAFKG